MSTVNDNDPRYAGAVEALTAITNLNTLPASEHVIPNHKPIKDSGIRQEFDTGSKRDSRAGKGRYDLLPMRALKRLALHFEGGALKYGCRNWEKGQPISRYLDSAMRHLCNHLEGKRDEDHMTAAAWNLMCAIDTEERINAGLLDKSLNDLPTIDETQTNS